MAPGSSGSSGDLGTSSATDAPAPTSTTSPDPDGTSSTGPDTTSGQPSETSSEGSLGSDASEGSIAESSTGDEPIVQTSAPECLPMDESSSSTGGEVGDPSCPSEGVLEVGVTHATLAGQTGDFHGSCASHPITMPDAEFVFTAPHDGLFGFDTYDHDTMRTVLYLLDDECGGNELECEEEDWYAEPDGKWGAAVSRELAMGETVTVVVDTRYFYTPGPFALAVTDVFTCPLGDLGDGSQPIEASTAFTADEFSPSCAINDDGHDGAFTFTAPVAGLYGFAAETEASYDITVAVFDGVCGSTELACSNNTLWSDAGQQIGAAVELAAGQTVTAVFSGGGPSYRAQFSMRVEPLDAAPFCPAADLGTQVPQLVQGTTLYSSDQPAIGCVEFPFEEAYATYLFTADQDGTYTFDTAGSEFATALEIRDGGCAGPSLTCVPYLGGTNAADLGAYVPEAGAAVDLVAGQTVAVSVGHGYGYGGELSLAVDRLEGPCTTIDLGDLAPPFAVSGDTTTSTNAATGSCAGFSEPDVSYTWTAPADGLFAISTEGSCFDSSVHVHEATCDGAELKCTNDISGDVHGRTVIEVTAGQTVTIVVDGQRGESGPYVLSVEPTVESGTCCAAHPGVGCSEAGIMACVCAEGDYCCTTEWVEGCASAAVVGCGASCP